jgi:hypothetical protein
LGLTALGLSEASVPQVGQVTNDEIVLQNLSEARVKKHPKPNFDGDIAKLAAQESVHHENPATLAARPEFRGAVRRLEAKKYTPSESLQAELDAKKKAELEAKKKAELEAKKKSDRLRAGQVPR